MFPLKKLVQKFLMGGRRKTIEMVCSVLCFVPWLRWILHFLCHSDWEFTASCMVLKFDSHMKWQNPFLNIPSTRPLVATSRRGSETLIMWGYPVFLYVYFSQSYTFYTTYQQVESRCSLDRHSNLSCYHPTLLSVARLMLLINISLT